MNSADIMTALKDGQPDESPRTPTEHVEIFLRLLRNAVRSRSVEAFVDLFHDEGWYRECVRALFLLALSKILNKNTQHPCLRLGLPIDPEAKLSSFCRQEGSTGS